MYLKSKLRIFYALIGKYKHPEAKCLGNSKLALKFQEAKQFLSYWQKCTGYCCYLWSITQELIDLLNFWWQFMIGCFTLLSKTAIQSSIQNMFNFGFGAVQFDLITIRIGSKISRSCQLLKSRCSSNEKGKKENYLDLMSINCENERTTLLFNVNTLYPIIQ